jgi:formate hydrogenlyase subunit 3/multisubunit Na+/H+ antiporter MnhD subunit
MELGASRIVKIFLGYDQDMPAFCGSFILPILLFLSAGLPRFSGLQSSLLLIASIMKAKYQQLSFFRERCLRGQPNL